MTKKGRSWRRRALVGAAVVGLGVPGLWYAIHQVPGVGPALADAGRAALGPGAIAWAEDVAYGVQDRIDRWRYKGAPPKTFWAAPPPPPAAPPAVAPAAEVPVSVAGGDAAPPPAPPEAESFPPPAFAPPSRGVAADGDGAWIPVKDGAPAGQPPVMYKSLVHPDPQRSFAAVAVVAVDLRRIDLHLVAGTQEPASSTVPSEHRPGMIPKEAQGDLVAAFNGGFKATHGHYGMMIDGETFLPPRDIGCTIAMYRDGSLRIRPWPGVKETADAMSAYRQTPPCLVEGGKVNTQLEGAPYNKNWGATVSGETVIRRSATRRRQDGARALLRARRGGDGPGGPSRGRCGAVGADDAAQLDVNY